VRTKSDFVVVIVEIENYELAAVQIDRRRTEKVSYFRDVKIDLLQ
jgi:hypothetical protein